VTIIRNTVKDAAGRPLRNHTVRVRLRDAGNPFLANGQGEVIQETTVSTDRSGLWSVDLTPQTELEAANGTYYEADERDGLKDGKVWRFQVPATGGPLWLRSVLIDGPPPSSPVPPVTAHELKDHLRTNLANPVAGNAIVYDGTNWVAGDVSGGGPHTHPITGVVGLQDALNALTAADVALDSRLDILEARPIVDSPDDIGAAPAVHTHTTAQVTGLDTTLIAYDTRLTALEARPVIDSPDDIGAAPLVHTHTIANVTGLQVALDAKLDDTQLGSNSGVASLDSGGRLPSAQLTVHGHAIADVTNLQTTLDGKEAAGTASAAVSVHDADSGAHTAIQSAIGTVSSNLSSAVSSLTAVDTSLDGRLDTLEAAAFTLSTGSDFPPSIAEFADAGTGTRAARWDHTHSERPATLARITAAEVLARRSQPTDRERYGDMLSSIQRRQATANDEYTTAFATFSGVPSPVGFSATKIRFAVQTAAVGGTAGFVAVYSGSNPANLTRRAEYVGVDAFTTLGLRELTLDATVNIAIGDYVYVMFGSAGFSTSPRVYTTVGAPAAVINAGVRYEGYGASAGTSPSTLDSSDSAWTSTNTTPWWALVP
jgi:hypothetical protein